MTPHAHTPRIAIWRDVTPCQNAQSKKKEKAPKEPEEGDEFDPSAFMKVLPSIIAAHLNYPMPLLTVGPLCLDTSLLLSFSNRARRTRNQRKKVQLVRMGARGMSLIPRRSGRSVLLAPTSPLALARDNARVMLQKEKKEKNAKTPSAFDALKILAEKEANEKAAEAGADADSGFDPSLFKKSKKDKKKEKEVNEEADAHGDDFDPRWSLSFP